MSVIVCSIWLRDIDKGVRRGVILKDGRIVITAISRRTGARTPFVELEVTGDDRNLRAALPEIGADGVPEGRAVAGVSWPLASSSMHWALVARQDLLVRKLSHRRDARGDFLKAHGALAQTPGESAGPDAGRAEGSQGYDGGLQAGLPAISRTRTSGWARFMVLPRSAWRRLYQQRLVVLLGGAFVWPLLCADSSIQQSRHAAAGARTEFRQFIQVNGQFFASSCTSKEDCRVPGCVGGAWTDSARPAEQRASAVLQPSAHALELRALND